MMRVITGLCMALASTGLAGELFDPPQDWVQLDLPNTNPDYILHLEGHASPDLRTRMTFTRFRPMQTTGDVDGMVRGFTETGQANVTFTEPVADTIVKGYPAKRIQAVIQPGQGVEFASETYLVFSDAASLAITFLQDRSTEQPLEVDTLWERVRIPGQPIALDGGGPGQGNEAYQFGHAVGRVMFWAFLVGVVVILIRRGLAKPKPVDDAPPPLP